MNRDTIRAGYVISVGLAILGLWGMLFATDQIPELTTVPYEIGYHLVAELLTALTLIAAGIGRLRQHRWLQQLYPIALGMLLYTVINSAGYYAQLGEFAMVGMFSVLTLATLLLVGEYTVDRHRTRSLRAAE